MVCGKVPCPDFFPDGEAERRVFFSAFAESALRTFLQRAPLDIDVSAKKKKKKKYSLKSLDAFVLYKHISSLHFFGILKQLTRGGDCLPQFVCRLIHV